MKKILCKILALKVQPRRFKLDSVKFIRAIPTYFILFFQIFLVGCTPTDPDDTSKSEIFVQVPVFKKTQYELDVVPLKTLTDIRHLDGQSAKFQTESSVVPNPSPAQGEPKNQLHGQDPQIRYFRRADGVYIPTDFLSLQLFSLYASFEKLKLVDESLGLGSLLKWPRKVVVQANVVSGLESMENTALYSGEFDAYVFVPYTENNMPLMVNQGVVAHEHFHALFQKLFLEPKQKALAEKVKTQSEKLLQSALIRAVNEGLADLWSYLLIGDPSFVGRSIESFRAVRDLNGPWAENIPTEANMNQTLKTLNVDEQISRAYHYGSLLAKFLKVYIDLLPSKDPLQVKKSVIDGIKNYELKSQFSFNGLLLSIMQQMPSLPATECKKILLHLDEYLEDQTYFYNTFQCQGKKAEAAK